MTKGEHRKRWLLPLFSLVILILLVTPIFAQDVAYIYRRDSKIDQNFIDVFQSQGLSVDTIQEEDVSSTDLSSYRIVFVGDERYREDLDVFDYPSIIVNGFDTYGIYWGIVDREGVSALGADQPLNVQVEGQELQVYTRATQINSGVDLAIPYYYLSDENKAPAMSQYAGTSITDERRNLGDVISFGQIGGLLENGVTLDEKMCFYGIAKTEYWTNNARDLFEECIAYVANECSQNSDCPDDEVSAPFCKNGDVFHTETSYTCDDAGTLNSECVEDEEDKLVEACEDYCESGECKTFVCEQNSDCDDSNASTLDTCHNPSTPQAFCTNEPVECFQNSDCGASGNLGDPFCSQDNLNQESITFTCNNPGLPSSFCSNETQTTSEICEFGCLTDPVAHCQGDAICGNGIIETGEQCDDSNTNDLDGCSSTCQNETILCSSNSDCGTDEALGGLYCTENNVTQDFLRHNCNNPGQYDSFCTNATVSEVQEICSEDGPCIDGSCTDIECSTNEECSDNNPYTFDECVFPGSPQSECRNTPINCITDSDCGFTGHVGNEYCSQNDIYKNLQNSTCVNPGTVESSCISEANQAQIHQCEELFCVENPQEVPTAVCVVCTQDSQCDDNNASTIDLCMFPATVESYCENTPSDPVCGNGILENGEQCDDGNLVSGDGCSSTCQLGARDVALINNTLEESRITITDLNDQIVSGDLMCNQRYKILVSVENTGEFTENVTFNGSVGSLTFTHTKVDDLLPGESKTDKVRTVNFTLAEGSYNLTVKAIIVNDSTPSDNFAVKEIFVLCSQEPNCIDSDGDGFNSSLSDASCGPVDCNDQNPDVNPNAIEVCDGIDNNCQDGIDETGNALCSDELFCNGAEVCTGESGCQLGIPIDCSANDSLECVGTNLTNTTHTCNEQTDSCEANVDVDVCEFGCENDMCLQPECTSNSDCDNGLYCDGQETCNIQTGICEPGVSPVVDDQVSCTVDYCDEQTDSIVHLPQHSICDNGLFCDGLEICDPVLDCQPGILVDCSVLDYTQCTQNNLTEFKYYCDEQTDSCRYHGTTSQCENQCVPDPEAHCSESECGNGIVEAGEQCDDGNLDNFDSCSNSCESNTIACDTPADCGVSGPLGDSFCVDHNVTQTHISHTCVNPGTSLSYCTSSTFNTTEETCEFGCETNSPAQCVPGPSCGNGIVEAGEQCDDGNNLNNDGCSSTCETEIIECFTHEECDDNNLYTYDTCSFPGTTQSFCSNTPINCIYDTDCGFTGHVGNEYCSQDDINKNFQNSTCVNPGLPESYCLAEVNPSQIDECEFACAEDPNAVCVRCDEDLDCNDNNQNTTDVCIFPDTVESYCENTPEIFCGNNITEFPEICDGNTELCTTPQGYSGVQQCNSQCNFDSCQSDEFCGDGIVNGLEECDLGASNGQGSCSLTCETVPIVCDEDSDCGTSGLLGQPFCIQNNVTQQHIEFTCNNPGTAQAFCSNTITNTTEETCDLGCTDGSCNEPVCGNGIIEGSEVCDDGNTNSGDGCSSTCEPEFECVVDADCSSTETEISCTTSEVTEITTSYSCINNECVQDTETEVLASALSGVWTCGAGMNCEVEQPYGTSALHGNRESVTLTGFNSPTDFDYSCRFTTRLGQYGYYDPEPFNTGKQTNEVIDITFSGEYVGTTQDSFCNTEDPDHPSSTCRRVFFDQNDWRPKYWVVHPEMDDLQTLYSDVRLEKGDNPAVLTFHESVGIKRLAVVCNPICPA